MSEHSYSVKRGALPGTLSISVTDQDISLETAINLANAIMDMAGIKRPMPGIVRLNSWPTVEDIRRYGRHWIWHSSNWPVATGKLFVATKNASSPRATEVVMVRNSIAYFEDWFSEGDYFEREDV